MEQEKQNYLNANIIEKGYNPEDLSNYIIRTKGHSPENLKLEEYKQVIEEFKNDQLNQAFSNLKSKEQKQQKTKEENENKPQAQTTKTDTPAQKKSMFYILYSPETYEIPCQKIQETPVNSLEKEKKKITIKVGDPVKVDGGFFSKGYYTYAITCEELKSEVRRTTQEIEWLREKLQEENPYVVIPPIIDESSYLGKFIDNSLAKGNCNLRYLSRFFEGICRKKVLRLSPILFNFLTLKEKEFEKYMENRKSFTLEENLANYINVKGHLKFDLTREKAIYSNELKRNLAPSFNLFKKLNETLNAIVNDFKNLSTHFKDLSGIFKELEEDKENCLKEVQTTKKLFSNLNSLFGSWSSFSEKQSEFFDIDLKEFFNYMNSDLGELSNLCDKFETCRFNYENIGIKLRNKKVSLFNSKNYAKWDLDPNEKLDPKELEKVPEKAYDKMFYKETQDLSVKKMHLVLIMNMQINQHKKLCKYFDERSKKLNENLLLTKQDLLADAFSLIKLLSLKI